MIGLERVRASVGGRTDFGGGVRAPKLEPGVAAEGRMLGIGKRAAFAEGRLFGKDGALRACATATCPAFGS
jgi:acyl-coenzyme A thioesterase PaaI-like protein